MHYPSIYRQYTIYKGYVAITDWGGPRGAVGKIDARIRIRLGRHKCRIRKRGTSRAFALGRVTVQLQSSALFRGNSQREDRRRWIVADPSDDSGEEPCQTDRRD